MKNPQSTLRKARRTVRSTVNLAIYTLSDSVTSLHCRDTSCRQTRRCKQGHHLQAQDRPDAHNMAQSTKPQNVDCAEPYNPRSRISHQIAHSVKKHCTHERGTHDAVALFESRQEEHCTNHLQN